VTFAGRAHDLPAAFPYGGCRVPPGARVQALRGSCRLGGDRWVREPDDTDLYDRSVESSSEGGGLVRAGGGKEVVDLDCRALFPSRARQAIRRVE
jgi:hypothetical protein